MPLPQRFPFLPRVVVALMSSLLLVLLGVTHATAQSSEPVSTGTLVVSEETVGGSVDPGDSITVSGSGFAPGAQIDIVIESDPVLLATVRADVTGYFETTVTIPTEGVAPGAHTLKATGPDATGGLRVLAVQVQVAGDRSPNNTGTGGTLPVTGGDLVTVALVGAGAVTLGGLLLQRRRNEAT